MLNFWKFHMNRMLIKYRVIINMFNLAISTQFYKNIKNKKNNFNQILNYK